MNIIESIDSVKELEDGTLRVVMTINEAHVRRVQKPFFLTKEEYESVEVGGFISWV